MEEKSKLEKYRAKISKTEDDKKKKEYEQKIKEHFQKLQKSTVVEVTQLVNGSIKETLRKPFLASLDQYKYPTDTNQAINTFGYGAFNKHTKLFPVIFDRRPLREKDVLINIAFCGVCHSDWHVIMDEWRNTKYPIVAGHEMTGTIIGVGSSAKKFKVGDYVALSPLFNSCRKCKACETNQEQYCENDATETYNMPDRGPGDILPVGPITQGGYSNLIVADEDFVFKLPDNFKNYMAQAAPLLCAGTTVYNAVKTLGIKKGEKLVVLGIGGLGHFLIKLCKVLGIYTLAITSSQWKLEDAKKLGANDAVMADDLNKLEKLTGQFDYVIDTLPFKHEIDSKLKLLKLFGTYCIVGSFYSLDPDFNIIIRKGKKIMGSNINSVKGTQEFLNFCGENNLLPEIELINFDQLNDTRDKLLKKIARYRFVIDIQGSMAAK